MASETIVIDVRTRGLAAANRDFNRLNAQVRDVDRTAQLLRRALALLGGAFAVRQFIGFANSLQNIQNRLRLVTSSTAEYRVIQGRLFDISNRTFQSIDNTTKLYQRAVPVLQNLGKTQNEVLNFVELYNQAVAISGSSTTEAANATQQFLQGLGGTFQAEEINSILDQLPIIADLIAAEFRRMTGDISITRSEIKKFGSEGKITAEVLFNAITNGGTVITSSFGRIFPTIAQQLLVLQNNAVRFFGTFAQSSGFVAAFGTAIGFLANNLELVTRLFFSLAQTIITLFVGQAIRRATLAIIAFVQTITISTVVGAVITALVALIAIITNFSDKLRISSDGAATFADLFVVAFNRVAAAVSSILLPIFNAIGIESSTLGEAFQKGFEFLIPIVGTVFTFVVNTITNAVQIIIVLFRSLVAPIANVFISLRNLVSTFLNALSGPINQVLSLLGITERVSIDFGQIEKLESLPLGDAVSEIGAILSGEGPKLFEGVTAEAEQRAQARIAAQRQQEEENRRAAAGLNVPQIPGGTPRPTDAATKSASQFSKSLRDVSASLQTERALLQESNLSYEVRDELLQIQERTGAALTQAQQARLIPLLQEQQFLSAQNEILRDLQQPEQERALRVSALNALLDQGRISQQAYNFALQEALPPFERTITDLDREIELLKLSETEYTRRQELLRIEGELKRQLTEQEALAITQRLTEIESLQLQNELLSQINGPLVEYQQNTAALNALYESGRISAEQYNTTLGNIRLNYLDTQTTAQAGFEAGMIRVAQQFTDVSDLAENTFVNAFQNAEDALVNFVTTGEFNFKNFVDTILADLTRLAIRQSITGPLAGLFSGGGGGGGFLGGLFSGGGGGGGGFLGNIIGGIGGLFGFQTGGRFMVGGVGGSDSQLVAFRATPGEEVSVRTPDQRRNGFGGSNIVINYNITTQDADSFGRSMPQILSRTRAGMDRASKRLNQG